MDSSLIDGLFAARIGLETSCFDAGNRARFVLVQGVAGYADRADDVATRGLDENAARIGDHAPTTRGRQHGEKLRRAGCALRERARAEAHAEGTPSFTEGDVEAENARSIFALEGNEVAARIEHGDGERGAIGLATLLEGGIDHGAGLGKGHGHIGILQEVTGRNNRRTPTT